MEGSHQADGLSAPRLAAAPGSPAPPAAEEPQTQISVSDNGLSLVRAALPVVALVFATAALFRGRDVLMPITMAFILAVIFTPLSNILEGFVGRFCSAALVVILAIGVIAAIGYFLTVELTQVADQVAGYSDNIGNKLAALEKSSPPWLRHLKYGLAEVQRRVQKDTPHLRQQSRSRYYLFLPRCLRRCNPLCQCSMASLKVCLSVCWCFFSCTVEETCATASYAW